MTACCERAPYNIQRENGSDLMPAHAPAVHLVWTAHFATSLQSFSGPDATHAAGVSMLCDSAACVRKHDKWVADSAGRSATRRCCSCCSREILRPVSSLDAAVPHGQGSSPHLIVSNSRKVANQKCWLTRQLRSGSCLEVNLSPAAVHGAASNQRAVLTG